MNEARSGFVPVALAVAIFLATVVSARAQQQSTQPPPIRTRVTLVPLDVRVVDRDGKPVTDLRKEDLTIIEDDVPQTISHFSVQSLGVELPAADEPVQVRKARTTALSPQNRRVFLLLLGRGRMTGPSKELDALDEFVGSRLLPQDRVAVLAYNRATDFTTNHRVIAGVIRRYRAGHRKIEALMAQYFSGLRAQYGSIEIPPHIQLEIDAVFEADGRPKSRQMAPGEMTVTKSIAEDARRTAEELQRAETLRDRPPGAAGLPDTVATETAGLLGMSFDEYVEQQVELAQDTMSILAGIDYLRRIDGEKHLAIVTPNGLPLGRVEHDRGLGAIASDARVALHIVFTGGTVGAPKPRFIPPSFSSGGRITMSPVPSASAVFNQTFKVAAMRRVAELTGGELTAFRTADRAFSRLDVGTRFQYLIGYYPSNPTWNGAYRRVQVKVNRPGVTVLHRQGYYARSQLVPYDRRELITYSRLEAAGRYRGEIQDIKVTMRQPVVTREADVHELMVEGTIDLSQVKFTLADGRHVASLDVGIYAGDARQRVVGETLKKVDLRLTDDTHQAMMRDGATFTATLSLAGEPSYVKVIVYDYASDLLGSAVVKLPK
jgi:VWFA-related protein